MTVKNRLLCLSWGVIDSLLFIKKLVWNCGIRYLWCNLWVRKDEFHWTLDTDVEAALILGNRYFSNLIRRRGIAHRNDLSVKKFGG